MTCPRGKPSQKQIYQKVHMMYDIDHGIFISMNIQSVWERVFLTPPALVLTPAVSTITHPLNHHPRRLNHHPPSQPSPAVSTITHPLNLHLSSQPSPAVSTLTRRVNCQLWPAGLVHKETRALVGCWADLSSSSSSAGDRLLVLDLKFKQKQLIHIKRIIQSWHASICLSRQSHCLNLLYTCKFPELYLHHGLLLWTRHKLVSFCCVIKNMPCQQICVEVQYQQT